jgi:hypothetical protein
MGSMSKRPSRTLIKASVKHELEAMQRFASLSVRTSPFFHLRRERTDRLARRFYAGKGIHSPNHAAKLKPAIEELMQK